MDAGTTDNSNTPRFVHLHLHSEYSLLDGGNKIAPLIKRVKQLGMNAVALTDHGNMFGAIEFYTEAKKQGVKPILGIEAYVAPGDRTDRSPTGVADGGFHLVLLAENHTGWRHLLKLSSDAFVNGFYYKPRMDKNTLAQWSDGLIAINGHLGSSIAHDLLQYVQTHNDAHYQHALEEAKWHAETFGTNEQGESRFFIELQRHDTPEQERINPYLIQLAKELDLPLVVDNDAHYLTSEDYEAHDTLCCVSMGKTKDDPDRLRYSKQLYVKSPQQMADMFPEVPEAVENTARIADRCNVDIDFSANHAPMVDVRHPGELPDYDGRSDATEWFNAYCAKFELRPFSLDSADAVSEQRAREACDRALRDLCEAGLIWRYGLDGVTENIRARLDRELQILADKYISAYFLICWDFVNWARQRGIPANARGSGVGTMVGYVLGLSNACPERYGLLFERFTDPDRSEYPDIDIDICQDGRADVMNYVRDKYGHVAQIITFGRLKARQAIKDVARVNGLSATEGQRLANLIPNELNITIEAALEKDPDFCSAYESEQSVANVIDTARKLENHARHAGVHAAGVVVATQPLDNIVPLCKATGSDDIVTQWDGPTCEKVGLLKMDFLGLRTLSTIERAKTLVRDALRDDEIWNAVGRDPGSGPHPLDLERLDYNDPHVLDLFQRGDTAGIFQFESGGMRKLLKDMQPDRLEDLIAANALYRPGPMDLIPQYCARKHGEEDVPSVHPVVDQYTEETYGIMVYQEQVMQIVHNLGDIPLREAYTLIKAISKKKEDVIDEKRPQFIEGAKQKGLSLKQANDLFDLILRFAGYGFNKSHSTGYAIIAYQTAYLKTYFPNQYMAALLTYESAARKVDAWAPYLEDCKHTRFIDHTEQQPHIGVEVRPPAINLSQRDFAVVFNEDEPRDALHGHVRFGLGAIKGAGHAAISAIITERDANGPFRSIFDFCERLSTRACNKATLESLVKCGAFDSLHGSDNRAAVFAAIDDAIRAGQTVAADRAAGQMNIFALAAGDEDAAIETADEPQAERPLPDVPPWPRLQMLANEKQTLGFHVSGHPLDEHERALAGFCNNTIAGLADAVNEKQVALGCILSSIRLTTVKRGASAGEKMAMVTLQDKTGSVEGVVFSDVFKHVAHHLHEDAVIVVVGRVDRSRGDVQIRVEDVFPPDDAPARLAGAIELHFVEQPDGDPLPPQMQMVAGLINQAAAGRVANGRNGNGNGHQSTDLIIRVSTNGQDVLLRPQRLRLTPDQNLLERLRSVLGPDAVRLMPK